MNAYWKIRTYILAFLLLIVAYLMHNNKNIDSEKWKDAGKGTGAIWDLIYKKVGHEYYIFLLIFVACLILFFRIRNDIKQK